MSQKKEDWGFAFNSATKYCFSNSCYLLKTEIHTQIFIHNHFCAIFGAEHKIGFLIRGFWSKLELFNLELPHIFKMINIKTVITSSQSVLITRPTRSQLGAFRACLRQVGRAWLRFSRFGGLFESVRVALNLLFASNNFSTAFLSVYGVTCILMTNYKVF